jgi:hypothetical protein
MPDKTGEEEAKNIKIIIKSLNDPSSAIGNKIKDKFYETFGERITEARVRDGQNLKVHNDFQIRVNYNTSWNTTEHKSSKQYTPIPESNTVCKSGVQFHNGLCSKYTSPKKYAQLWYDKWIASGTLAKEYDIKAAIPTFEEWYTKDCNSLDPRTPFSIEQKAKVRAVKGGKGSLLKERLPVNEAFNLTDEEQVQMKNEVLAIANDALEQKDYWLEIHGNLEGEFHLRWFPKFTLKEIKQVTILKHDDIKVEFKCTDDFIFHSYLRWGKGAGFSNLRFDLRFGSAPKQRVPKQRIPKQKVPKQRVPKQRKSRNV